MRHNALSLSCVGRLHHAPLHVGARFPEVCERNGDPGWPGTTREGNPERGGGLDEPVTIPPVSDEWDETQMSHVDRCTNCGGCIERLLVATPAECDDLGIRAGGVKVQARAMARDDIDARDGCRVAPHPSLEPAISTPREGEGSYLDANGAFTADLGRGLQLVFQRIDSESIGYHCWSGSAR